MESGNEFHSVIVLAAKDFWNWVEAQRDILSLCLVVDPLTGLTHRTRSSWFIGTATCSFRILYRKVNRLMRLRSFKGSRWSWCNRAVTLVPRSCLLVIQRAALLWTLSSASLSLMKWGSHTTSRGSISTHCTVSMCGLSRVVNGDVKQRSIVDWYRIE